MLVILSSFCLRVLAGHFTTLRRTFRIFLAVGIAEAAFGIFCFYANVIFNSEIGMEIGQYGDFSGTYGLQFEANILGSYCGVCSVVLLAMFLYYRRREFLMVELVTLTGISISLARGALRATIL